MKPILSNLFNDYESLHEYNEARKSHKIVDDVDVFRRLVSLERKKDTMKSDSFYEGLYDYYIPQYTGLCDLLWKMPFDLSLDYFCRISGHVFVKKERFDGWSNLLCQYPPSFVIAASLLDVYSNDLLEVSGSIEKFVDDYLSQFKYTLLLHPYIPDLNHFIRQYGKLNDLHIHLNGTTETDVVWVHILKNPHETAKLFFQSFTCKYIRKHVEQLIPNFTPDLLSEYLYVAKELRNELLNHLASNNELCNSDYKSIYQLWGNLSVTSEYSGIQEELLLYLMIMSDLRRYDDNEMAVKFHHYLLIKGLIHQFLVMQHSQVGFSQFQLLTFNNFRDSAEKQYKERFLQLAGNLDFPFLKVLEGRFSPKDSSPKNSFLVSNIVKGFECAKRESDLLSSTELSLIAHFIKQPEKGEREYLPIRHRFLRNDLKKKAIALVTFIKNSKYGKYIAGVDAAANEMDAGPEVFAPTFRFLRKAGIKHFTFHVGEDFRHLLSGLRFIMETVDFLDLHRGDRLGHCTAIGISPDLWISRVGNVCFLPQGEWLDNLVFVWEMIKESGNIQLQALALNIESHIAELSHKVYGKCYPPYILKEAWNIRKFDPFVYLEKRFSDADDWVLVDTMEEINRIKESLNRTDTREIYELYHVSSVIGGTNKYDKIIEVKTDELINSNQLLALQNIVLEILSRKGIVIEALPTSNLRISYYQRLEEHHLKRWLDTSESNCMLPSIVLGTDDPGIFMTNIFNEYAKVYLALERNGCQIQERYEKLASIHRYSEMYKFQPEN